MSQAAQLFDPLAGSGADQDLHPGHLVTRTFPVNDIDADRWQNFLDDLPRADIKVPRWLMITGPVMKIHGFVDTSEKAYEAAVYLRKRENSEWHTGLIMAKIKVAPLKQMSLSRLELCAASLLTRC